MACNCWALRRAVDDKVVAFRFPPDCFIDGGRDKLVALRLPQRSAKVGGIFLTEAHIERACAGEPHAVAAFAEIVGEGCDEAKPPSGLLNLYVACRSACLVGNVCQRELA